MSRFIAPRKPGEQATRKLPLPKDDRIPHVFFFAAYKQLPDSAYAARDNAPIDLFPKLA
jgi:hypothetical protein